MKTKLLCITMLIFTVLIFGGNHYAARNEFPEEPCTSCFCDVKLLTVQDPKAKEEPSCSVVFTYGRYMNLKLPPEDPKLPQLTVQHLYRSHVPDSVHYDINACNPVVFCDKKCQVKLECYARSGHDIGVKEVDAYGENRCPIVCESSDGVKDVRVGCSHWERPAPTPAPKPPSRKRGLQWQESSLLPGFFDETMQTASVVSRFLPANYIYAPADEPEAKGIITRSAIWWLLEGEGGIDEDTLTVATGEAAARSFCTGDAVRVAGPGAISLPNCQVDATGRWEGGYVRRLPDGKLAPVSVDLNLRKEAGTLKGKLTTSDGTFDIVQASESGSDIRLQAERTIAGTLRRITLHGKLAKGDITIDGFESSPGEKTHGLTGFLRRLHIADSAVPPAVANQPYSFKLTAISPDDQAITFRLASPAISKPEQITWNVDAKALRGRNGERFTYGCPPANPSINPTVYGTDVYTDDSSICKAAVHSGLISPQAGGVITIQIKPDAGSYTASTRNGVSSKSYGAYKGSYVFVRVESNGGERGRLPKGLSFDSRSGTFLGTPTELGSFDISVVADDGTGKVFEQPLTLTVKKLVVTNSLLLDGFVGQPYTATLKVAGGQPPYRFSGNVPKGLQLNPTTGELSGTPSSPVSYASFEVTVSDSQNNSESQNVSLSVRGATIMNSHFLPDAKVGVPYRTQFQAVGTLSPINWVFGQDAAGSIGLALNERTGELSGTPTRAGDFFIEVTAEVGSSVASRHFALTIKPR